MTDLILGFVIITGLGFIFLTLVGWYISWQEFRRDREDD